MSGEIKKKQHFSSTLSGTMEDEKEASSRGGTSMAGDD